MISPDADRRRATARELWPDAKLPVAAIAEKVGVSQWTVRRWAKLEGWTGRTTAKPGGAAAATRTAGDRSRKAGATGSPRKIVRSLYRILNHNVQVMESRMSDDNASGSSDPERDMRALNSAVRSAEKLKELETEHIKRDTGAASTRAAITPEEEDRIRRRVIDHLLKLRERKRREAGDT